MKRLLVVVFAVVSCLLVGFILKTVHADSLDTLYPSLVKSLYMPSTYVYHLVWAFLYICMGLSIGVLINSRSIEELILVKLFTFQMLLNVLWVVLFFYFKMPLLSLLVLVFLDIVLVAYAWKVRSESRLSCILFIPYILWISFTIYLNLYVVMCS